MLDWPPFQKTAGQIAAERRALDECAVEGEIGDDAFISRGKLNGHR